MRERRWVLGVDVCGSWCKVCREWLGGDGFEDEEGMMLEGGLDRGKSMNRFRLGRGLHLFFGFQWMIDRSFKR
jgi:hypothetical protein